jgi:leucine dehydrogenase
MGRKSALAGLWWGGGKGLIAKNNGVDYSDHQFRDALFGEYGKFITSLRGLYYGAEDVGLTEEDTLRMFKYTRFATCIPKRIGGSGNPSGMTAKGTVCGMEGALEFLKPGDTLKGKKIVMQGAGNVASFMIQELLKKGVAHIKASDINENVIKAAKEKYKLDSRVDFVLKKRDDNSILEEECDILAPNALGGILDEKLIPKIKAPIVLNYYFNFKVCGAANNQLFDATSDELLKKRGIIYVPDFLNNRMGIVNCANEMYGYVDEDPEIERHFGREWKHSIINTTLDVLNESKKTNIGTDGAAKKIADELQKQTHPIFGHRGKKIVQSILKSNWVNEAE